MRDSCGVMGALSGSSGLGSLKIGPHAQCHPRSLQLEQMLHLQMWHQQRLKPSSASGVLQVWHAHCNALGSSASDIESLTAGGALDNSLCVGLRGQAFTAGTYLEVGCAILAGIGLRLRVISGSLPSNLPWLLKPARFFGAHCTGPGRHQTPRLSTPQAASTALRSPLGCFVVQEPHAMAGPTKPKHGSQGMADACFATLFEEHFSGDDSDPHIVCGARIASDPLLVRPCNGVVRKLKGEDRSHICRQSLSRGCIGLPGRFIRWCPRSCCINIVEVHKPH
jgi:hypothetical protein